MARLPSVTDLVSWIKGLERRVRILETAPRLGNASIGSGGLRIYGDNGLIVEDLGRVLFSNGGSLLMKDKQGREYFYAGGFQGVGFGHALYRLDGSVALLFADDDPDNETVQRIRLMDRNGRSVIAEDPSGSGIAWPLVPFTTYCDDYRLWGGSADAAFKSCHGAQHFKHSPKIYVRVKHTSSAADTTGEVRVTVNGTQIGNVVPSSFSINQSDFGPVDCPGDMHSFLEVRAEARRTGGTGEVRAVISLVTGWAS